MPFAFPFIPCFVLENVLQLKRDLTIPYKLSTTVAHIEPRRKTQIIGHGFEMLMYNLQLRVGFTLNLNSKTPRSLQIAF